MISLDFIGKIFKPLDELLFSQHITIFVGPLFLVSIYAYIVLRRHKKGDKYTGEQIGMILVWVLCLILVIVDTYVQTARPMPWQH